VSGGATPAALTHELLRWVSAAPRTYRDVVEAWVSNCPRHPVWDDAVSDGLVTVDGRSVLLTSGGRAALIREAEA
jgi:hypothetical protein